MTNCAGEPHISTSRSDEPSTNLSVPKVVIPEKPYGLTPEKNDSTPFSLPGGSGQGAAEGAIFIGAAMALSAVLPSNSQREDLRGSCLYGDSINLAMSSPCFRVTASLIDEEKNVHAKTETDENGRFRFYIPKGQFFYVQVTDRRGRTSTPSKKAGQGDIVSIFLKL